MSTENDVARSLRSWLREERHEDADRVLDAVIDQVPATPQRRASWLAWRLPPVNNMIRVGIAAAAVVVAAILGISYLNRLNTGESGPNASSTPNPSTTIPLLSEQGTIEGSVGLAAGTYLLADPFPARLALTVPSGWMVWHVDFLTAGLLVDSGPGDGSGYGLFFLSPGDKLYADPCDKTRGLLEPVPGSADDLAAALADLPGMTSSAPTEIELDGHPAALVELTAPTDAATCAAGAATLWDFPGQDDYPMALGERLPVRIVDVDGVRLVIVATDYPATSAWEVQHGVPFDPAGHSADQVELQGILDSIVIDP